ncbi:MAG: hypothetical protein HYU66_04970, partial [Armatimonadetes bacterium]|nr:hypothetical protein [Armatimonadota bacterium]
PRPGYATVAERTGTGVDRTSSTDRDEVAGTLFFNPDDMWENRLLDAEQELPSAPADAAPTIIKDSEPDRPIEILLRAGDAADATPANKWGLRGIDTTAQEAYVDPAALPAADSNTTKAAEAVDRTDVNGMFAVLGGPLGPVDLRVNLKSGLWSYYDRTLPGWGADRGHPRSETVRPGIGMLELQFEYETNVKYDAQAFGNGITWDEDPSINNNRGLFGQDDTWQGAPPPNRADDPIVGTIRATITDATPNNETVLPTSFMTYRVANLADQRDANAKSARDPLRVQRDKLVTDAVGTDPNLYWKIRRFSAWPFHNELPQYVKGTGGVALGNYLGGPIVCRFVVAPFNVVPEDATDPDTGALAQAAYYDPGAGHYYPQMPIAGVDPDLWRPDFLLGYRGAAGAPAATEDYFFPIRPGSSSAAHTFFLRTLLDLRPGGVVERWVDDGTPEGHALKGPADVYELAQVGGLAPYYPKHLSFEIARSSLYNGGNPVPSAMMYAYDLAQTAVEGGAAQTVDGVGKADGFGYDNANAEAQRPWKHVVNRAFDGDLAGAATATESPNVLVVAAPTPEKVGTVLDSPSTIDRIEVRWSRVNAANARLAPGTELAGDWTLELRPVGGAFAALATPFASPLPGAGNSWSWLALPAGNVYDAVRVVNNAGANLLLDELRVVTRGDIRHEVLNAADSPLPSTDPLVRTQPVSGSSVHVGTLADREISTDGAAYLAASLKVDVPPRQPPSRDAVQRQILVDQNLAPGGYVTQSQPPARYQSGAGTWDRYRGEVAVFVDDSRQQANSYDVTAGAAKTTALTARQRDCNLYQLQDGSYQFVSWYDEQGTAAGTVGGAGGAANLSTLSASQQRVAVEPYGTFDFEFSVAYDRRLRIAEKLLDFGKITHGSVSQWVPVTLINEGNVPLRDIKLYLDLAPTAVETEDGASLARQAQMQWAPDWNYGKVAVGGGGERSLLQLSTAGSSLGQPLADGTTGIAAADVGSPSGTMASDLYVRLGRLTATEDVRAGMPIGSFRGTVQGFVDERGDPAAADARNSANQVTDANNQPDAPSETSIAGAADVKVTFQEAPLARIAGFWDNEVDRRSDPAVDLMPFDPTSNLGTYQPVPVFGPWYTDPDRADACPAVAMLSDSGELGNTPPNASDQLWTAWATLTGPAGQKNWALEFRNAGLQTGWRNFIWPNAAALPLSDPANAAAERNLNPALANVPTAAGTAPQVIALWQNERQQPEGRVGRLEFRRFELSASEPPPQSGVMLVADDSNKVTTDLTVSPRVDKQCPRGVVTAIGGTGVLWAVWQSGTGGQSTLGFNALALDANYDAAANTYQDAVAGPTSPSIVNYALRTPPGLTNVIDPSVLASYRHEVYNTAAAGVRSINVFYSAWSPLRQNADIYWGRYRPVEDPTDATTLLTAPMAEDAYRFGDATGAEVSNPAPGDAGYLVRTQPGGRLPFPRVTNELLSSNENHTVYGTAGGVDWIMPPVRPRVSYVLAGARTIEEWNHRGFADTGRPLVDSDRAAVLTGAPADPNLDPLVILRVFQGPTVASSYSTNPAVDAARVTFDLGAAYFDPGAGEWVLPVTGPAFLLDRGVDHVRIHPGLGRVTFNKPLYRRLADLPIYVYATYRPCGWRLTSDPSADTQPTAAFDAWERLVVSWRRVDEGGVGRLWYRTFSLAVPLLKAPVTQLEAVVNDEDSTGDFTFNGGATLDFWSFVGVSGGQAQAADPAMGNRAWSSLTLNNGTTQGYSLTTFGGAVSAGQGNALVGQNAAGMLWFSFNDAGKRVRIWYDTTSTNPASRVEEAQVVPGLGPERLVPTAGVGDETRPALAVENVPVGYRTAAQAVTAAPADRILASRYWLVWASTRDLYVPGALGTDPPRRGVGGSNRYYASFQPDFAAASTAR